jgi:hypothetical protein
MLLAVEGMSICVKVAVALQRWTYNCMHILEGSCLAANLFCSLVQGHDVMRRITWSSICYEDHVRLLKTFTALLSKVTYAYKGGFCNRQQ